MNYIGYIYMITSPTNRKYIGQHKKSFFDKNYWGTPSKNNDLYKEYQELKSKGIYNFENCGYKREILEWCTTVKELGEKETYWILKEKSTQKEGGYNRNLGGCKYTHISFSKESKQKMKNTANKRWKNKEERLKFSEMKRKQCLDPNSVYQSKEYKEKMRISCTGKHHSKETKKKMSNSMRGLKRSEESRKKMSESRKGMYKNNHWYNNGIICKFCKDCPEGFVLGRLSKKLH